MNNSEIEIIILTRSSKHGNYCIAGIDVATKNFVRLNSEDVETHGAISRNTCTYENGILCTVLDKVIVRIKRAAPLSTQPENLIIDNGYYWNKISECTVNDILKYRTKENTPYIFGDTSYCVDEIMAKNAMRSLVLVLVSDVVICKVKNSNGEPKSKISFIYNGKAHNNYSITDPDFYNIPDGTAYNSALLVISLPDSSPYFKFVSKIFINL